MLEKILEVILICLIGNSIAVVVYFSSQEKGFK